jgi:phosphoglycolate phosphatase-like HAD superfamily hydrolase
VAVAGEVDAPTLVLWDVDHTLIENGGTSKANYLRAFEILLGRPATSLPRTEGRTDPAIMLDLLRAHDVDPEAYRPRFAEVLAEAMRENAAALRERGNALPGAKAALAALTGERNVVQSVLTGNIPQNARAKLAAFGLDDLIDFEIGGYGTDSIVRAELVPIAQARASAKHGRRYDSTSTILIGDTVRDVRAGLDGGALVIAVATGEDTQDVLRESGAHAVLPDLSNTARFVRTVKNVRERESAAAGRGSSPEGV